MRKWRVEDSAELYNINGWGVDYFSINEKGNVEVKPQKNSASVDLKELLDELILSDVSTPLLLGFLIFWTTGLLQYQTASNRHPRNMDIKPRTLLYILLR